jgi:hypothetical protein
MRDGDVRAALRTRLDVEHRNQPDTLTIDELALCGQVRVDVAVVNGYLAGFELKSERDTLRRLPTQVDVYSRVLDLATLVVADKHHAHAAAMLPDWWGVTVATSTPDGVALEVERGAEPNEAVDPHSLVRLLWHDETLAELELRDLAAGVRSKPRAHAWRRLADELSIEELRSVVRARLKARRGWRAGR